MVFRARVGNLEIEGIDLIRDDVQGQVVDLTVMVRPLSATVALVEGVRACLEMSAPNNR